MSLDAVQRRWLVVNALLVTAVVNAVLNALFAWLGMRERNAVAAWTLGPASTGTDSLGTLFVLPFVTCLLCTTVVRRQRRSGSLARVRGLGSAHPWLAALPQPLLVRAVVCGAAVFAVLAPPVAVVVLLADPGPISVATFVAYKAIFGVVLGAIVTPLIALRAMAEP